MGGSHSKERPRRVAVLGGGPAGLTAAYRLLKTSAPIHVDVYEASPRFGGSILTETTAEARSQSATTAISSALSPSSSASSSSSLSSKTEFLYDLGPNSMNLKHAAVAHLVLAQLGLADRIERRDSPRRILILRGGRLHPVPLSLPQFLRSSLLSPRAKARALLREPLVPRLADRPAASESVAQFVARRLGPEVRDYVVDPALAGIYSAAPAQLSLKHAFPTLFTLERDSGSLIIGLVRRAITAKREKKKQLQQQQQSNATAASATDMTLGFTRKQLGESISFRGGMQTLPNTLETALRSYTLPEARARLRARTPVRSLERDAADGTWRVNGGRTRYDAVVSTLPAHALGAVESNVHSVRRGFARLARRVRYAPVSVVVLGFRAADVPDDVYGFGALFPSAENRRILGVNFSSAGFPSRLKSLNASSSPSQSHGKDNSTDRGSGGSGGKEDRTYLTVYLGGSRQPDMVLRKPEEIAQVAAEEVRATLGVRGDAVFARVKNWPLGIPVYHPGYDDAVCAMARVEKRAGGLVLAGNYRGGVGVPDALLSGMVAADRVKSILQRQREAEAGKAGKPRLPKWSPAEQKRRMRLKMEKKRRKKREQNLRTKEAGGQQA